MSIILIHLSDIHISAKARSILSKPELIAAALNGAVATANLVAIVVSGDVAGTGSVEEYSEATDFLNRLQAAVQAESRAPVKIIISPGNHDCDFRLNNANRDNNIESLTRPNAKIDNSVIECCTAVQQPFLSFRARHESEEPLHDDGLWRTTVIEMDGKTIQFDALNVAWVSKIREDKNLYFPIARYEHLRHSSADARFIVMHHPLNWYNPTVYRPLRKFVRDISSIVLSGHEHEGNVGIIDEAESSQSAYVEGCVLQHGDGNLTNTGFHLLKIDLEERSFLTTTFVYSKGRYVPQENRSWEKFRPLPQPSDNRLQVSSAFLKRLRDPGAVLKLSNREVSLGDIFVYPHVRDAKSETPVRKFVDSKMLLEPDRTAGGVVIESDERGGSTSLLQQLFLGYLERGYGAIYLRGRDIKRGTEQEIERTLEQAIRSQYESRCITDLTQLSRTKKILLVDDFDESPIKSVDDRAALLSLLLRKFDHAVVVVAKNFELQEILDKDAEAFAETKHMQLQPLGFAKRAELVQRWFSLGADGTVSEGEFIGRCDTAERLISSAMHKSLIPSAPLYLLTLLQSIEAGRESELKDSALGHYYHFLLSDAFLASGVSRNKLAEHFQYATHLAWEYHRRRTSTLNIHELSEFNRKFTDEWTTVDFRGMLETLLNSRVLTETGGEYSFRYPYMYYHLKGKYISDNNLEPGMRAYVSQCCDHLYVRDNANTILFLAHHTNEEWLLEHISTALKKLFYKFEPVDFEQDTGRISMLLADAPDIVFKGGSPAENRARINRERDELDDDRDDGMHDREESDDELSLSAQLMMLIKTAEILGQVLKNQYSTIRRPKKRELILELFRGPMRALTNFYIEMGSSPDRIIESVQNALGKRHSSVTKEQREALARRIVAELVQGVTVALLLQPAKNANSSDLYEDVNKVVDNDGSLSFRLIQLAIRLDSADSIPRKMVSSLYYPHKDDPVVSNVIKVLVVNRLYMFKTSENDMKWINTELDIPLRVQHSITYQQAGQKLN